MGRFEITEKAIQRYIHSLKEQEYAQGSIEKYVRDIRALKKWVGHQKLERQTPVQWKTYLLEANYQPRTINAMLSALNSFFRFMGWEELCVKYLKIQRNLFRNTERELTKSEYIQLVQTAEQQGKHRLALLTETICTTGIRVSEVKYITAEAVQAGQANIQLKGKIRTVLIPGKLCKKLRKYAQKQKIVSGEIFLTRNNRSLSRHQIWAEMKKLCTASGITPSKVFPHNLRYLFARTFYRIHKDVARLADVLGHSSIETTRIYLISSGTEHMRQIERLGLLT